MAESDDPLSELHKLKTANQAVSAISFVVLAVPLLLIAFYNDTKFARERFVLATLIAALLLNIFLAMESFDIKGVDALLHGEGSTIAGQEWCGYLGFEIFTQWLVQFELSLVIYYTFYSIATLETFPLKTEIILQSIALLASVAIGTTFGATCHVHCRRDALGECVAPLFYSAYGRDFFMLIPAYVFYKLARAQRSQQIKINQAKQSLTRSGDMSKADKARNKQLLNHYRTTIRTVYKPLRFYPIFFAFILGADIATYSIYPGRQFHEAGAFMRFMQRIPAVHLVWCICVCIGSSLIYFAFKDNREHLSRRQLRRRFRTLMRGRGVGFKHESDYERIEYSVAGTASAPSSTGDEDDINYDGIDDSDSDDAYEDASSFAMRRATGYVPPKLPEDTVPSTASTSADDANQHGLTSPRRVEREVADAMDESES
eukprot:TRINITY_DN10746_c0_g2_i1.p1 TRINITY_DN10746_c0_g2~~TRINITY_DN10746_c0_g2_i1.p1  ORF type:complete len:430 (+),score=58.99 TRINITY_DN10746_c0_g2_i1:156-1445(+)